MALRHILLVDDDYEFLELTKDLLQSHGFTVTTASDGIQALKTVSQQDIDAIVCDLMMPNMAGDMFYMAVQKIKPHLCRRFIVLTGHQKHPKLKAFLETTRTVVLYKPVNMSNLLAYLNMALKQADTGEPPAIKM